MSIDLLVKTPKEASIVYKDLRLDCKDVIRVFRLLEADWPEALDTVKVLCEHVSDGLCLLNGRPVLYAAVQCGLAQYSANHLKEDDYRYTLFLKTVFDSIGAALHSHIAVHNASNSSWRPDDDECFYHWWGDAQEADVSVVKGTCTKESVVEALMLNVLEDFQLEMLTNMKEEAS